MKLGRSTARRTLAALLVAAFVMAWVPAAYAALEDMPSGTSKTNPNAGDAAWREGWGNSLYPEITISNVPSDPGTKTTGFYYSVARGPIMPDPFVSSHVGVSWDPEGTIVTHDYDITGIYNSLGDADRDYIPQLGETIHDAREGIWTFGFRFFNDSRVATSAVYVPLGIDLTKPFKVEDFKSGVLGPTETSRRNFTWTNKEYDELSGGRWYRLFLNDTEKPIAEIPVSPLFPGKATIEHLEPGVNKVGIQVMDRATNVSDIVWVKETVDPDTPSLSITAPESWAWLNGTKTFSATSVDQACDPKVSFKIDGVLKGTDSAPPYQLSVDTRKLSAGTHLLTVRSTDLKGHFREATRYFRVDNTPIRISSMSVGPNPFYPILHDGYKDTTTMHAYLNEGANELYLEIYDDAGTMIRNYKRTGVGAGSVSMSWDGKSSSGGVTTGDFWYRFVAKDRAGNWTKTGMGSVIIRDYEIVRVGPDEVRVVPR